MIFVGGQLTYSPVKGSQSHLAAATVSGVQGALEALAGTGVSEVAITELDIGGADHDDYWVVANACLQVSACVGITTWGVSDNVSCSTTFLYYCGITDARHPRTLGELRRHRFCSIQSTSPRMPTILSQMRYSSRSRC